VYSTKLLAKGYIEQCEKDLGNGGIGIAAASRPSREIVHIKIAWPLGMTACLVFADRRTLERTQEALMGEFSEAGKEKVQFLHLSKLSELVYNIISVRKGKIY
jgi:hypothetical protein